MVCGTARANMIHFVFFLCGMLMSPTFIRRFRKHFGDPFEALALYACTVVIACQLWLVYRPPLFDSCAGELKTQHPQQQQQQQQQVLSAFSCDTTLGPHAADLIGMTVRDFCPEQCQAKTLSNSVDWMQVVGWHACSRLESCRFETYGWSSLILLAVFVNIGIQRLESDKVQGDASPSVNNAFTAPASSTTPSHGRRSDSVYSKRGKDREEGDMYDTLLERFRWVRVIFRWSMYTQLIFFFVIVHVAETPYLVYVTLGLAQLLIVPLYLKYIPYGKPNKSLQTGWNCYLALLFLFMSVEYLYTNIFISSVINEL